MFKIALIQNQSEMSHYGYADARDFISNLSFVQTKVQLYTAQNISKIIVDIKLGYIDSIVLASHATNDITIKGVLFSPEFKDALAILLERDGGLLILHQLRLGENALKNAKEGELSFLPNELATITAMARESGESYLAGSIANTVSDDYLLRYPHSVDIEKLNADCVNNIGLKGKYWHYWDNIDSGVWDTLLEDENNKRALVLVSKEALKGRVVVSSMTLDWQKQSELFENLLLYVVEGKRQVAFLKSNTNMGDVDTRYLAERLKSKKIPYAEYQLPDAEKAVYDSIATGIHSIIVVTKESQPFLSGKIEEILDLKKDVGEVKTIFIDKGKFTVSGRERDELRVFYNLKMDALDELSRGYIDGSFWGTIETLQVLQKIDKKAMFEKRLLNMVKSEIAIHDKEGSYDGVFGATCALLWFRASFLSPEDSKTLETLSWLFARKEDYEIQEKLLLYQTMLATKAFGNYAKQEDIKQTTHNLLERVDSVKEMNAAIFLTSANYFEDKKNIVKILNGLSKQQQDDGLWIDLATTASIVSVLLESRNILKEEDDYANLKILDKMLFSAVAAIQKKANRLAERPWGEKISINLRCIEALLAFDSLIELPITEIIDSIDAYAINHNKIIASEKGILILSRMSQQLLTERVHAQEQREKYLAEQRVNAVIQKLFNRNVTFVWMGLIFSTILLCVVVLLIVYLIDKTDFTKNIIAWILGVLPLIAAMLGFLAKKFRYLGKISKK